MAGRSASARHRASICAWRAPAPDAGRCRRLPRAGRRHAFWLGTTPGV